MIFGQPFYQPLLNCLNCDRLIPEHVWDTNNGTCDHCPELEGKGENPFDRRGKKQADALVEDESSDGNPKVA